MDDDVLLRVDDGIWRIAAPNAEMNYEPTNVYLFGNDPMILIDAGSPGGADVILQSLEQIGRPRLTAIVLTHTHPDHAGGIEKLRDATGAPVWVHPDALREAEQWQLSVPIDHELREGWTMSIDGFTLEAIETPGHALGHVSLLDRSRKLLVAGDLVSGEGTVAIVPPFGNMAAYLDSLNRVREAGVMRMLPGHGPVMDDGQRVLAAHIRRRLSRESQILDLVRQGYSTVEDIVTQLYPGASTMVHHAAMGTTVAHLAKLLEEGRVRHEGDDQLTGYVAV